MPGHDNPIPISDLETRPTQTTVRNRMSSDQQLRESNGTEDVKEAKETTESTSSARGDDGHSRSNERLDEVREQDTEADTNDRTDMVSTLNFNGYTTKKSLAQGMLDLALLASNAAQLKFILSAEGDQPLSTVLIVLIITSICLQVFQVIICVVLGLILDINKVEEQRRATICNDISVAIVVMIVALNVIISAFDMRATTQLRIVQTTTFIQTPSVVDDSI